MSIPVASLLGDGLQRYNERFLGYLFYVGDRYITDLPYCSEETSNDTWYRLRNEEALTSEKIVEHTVAVHEKYRFKDFKLKGEVFS